jgi:hypothetical protein
MNQISSVSQNKPVGFAKIFALLSSVIGIIFLLTTLFQKPQLPHEVYSSFSLNRGSYILFAVISLIWSLVSVPAIIAMIYQNKSESNAILSISTIFLYGAGIMLNGIISFLYVGALLSVDAASQIDGANAPFQMAFFTNLFYFLSDPGLMIWGLGMVLHWWLLTTNNFGPKWIRYIVGIGGVFGSLTLLVFQTPILALGQFLCFLILITNQTYFWFKQKV